MTWGAILLQGEEGLGRLIAESEALVLAAPETPDTRGILTRERIAALRPDAVVVNVSRGGLVDEDALVAALREGRIRGAALDVFRTEPLPEGHPIWSLPSVLVTPHISAVSRGFWRRHNDLVLENLERFLAGEPCETWWIWRPGTETAPPAIAGGAAIPSTERRGRKGRAQSLTTFSAAGPFWPWAISNSTRSPSFRLLKPSPWMALWWTKQSLDPSSGVMKPYPLASLNHFTVPVVRITVSPFWV
jgi:hypothetical protein